MSIFNSLSYREIIKDKISTLKKTKPGFGVLRVSQKAGLHGSFVSSALKGHKHLSSDQVFALGEQLGFSYKELDYLLLLLNYERSVNQNLKAKYLDEIKAIQKENSKTTTHISTKPQESLDLDLAEYYSDPFYKIIHVFLGIEQFRQDPNLLALQLGITHKQTQKYLKRLEDFEIIKFSSPIEVLKKNYHLPKDFFICKPHQATMKLLSQQTLLSLEEKQKESVCVTFTGEEETFKKVHNEFLDFLKKAEKHVKYSVSKEVFQMNFDLHFWSK